MQTTGEVGVGDGERSSGVPENDIEHKIEQSKQPLPEAATGTELHMTPASDLSSIAAVAPFNEVDTRAILRQVEYYFSDQNLPADAHLLGLAGGDGNGPVSINRITGFKKMRRYKPMSAVKDVLECSAVLELVDNRKRIKRRFPLQLKLHVKPEIDIRRLHIEETLATNPHLTKAMLKPTGFEEYYADAPVTPQQYEQDRRLYDKETSFETRIEIGIRMYRTKRKMHQSTLRVFELWMSFGGIDMSPNAFSGGVDKDEMKDLSKEEKAALQCPYGVSEQVIIHDEVFEVNFKKVAMSFLSTEFPLYFRADIRQDSTTVCNVMTNFFNYLLHHDVCPEYNEQIYDARRAVKEAELELHQLIEADMALHASCGFQVACAVLHELPKAKSDPWSEARETTYSLSDAKVVFQAGIAAFGTISQLQEVVARSTAHTLGAQSEPDNGSAENTIKLPAGDLLRCNSSDEPIEEDRLLAAGWRVTDSVLVPPMPVHSPFAIIGGEEMGLEIIALIPATDAAAAYFEALSETAIPRMGIMRCRRWLIPGRDLKSLDTFGRRLPDEIDFIVEDKVLQACRVGMKLQCEVRQLDIGIYWLERVERTLPSFYDYLPDFRSIKAHLKRLHEVEEQAPQPRPVENVLTLAQQPLESALVESVC